MSKPLVESPQSQFLIRTMIVISWLSFIISLWAAFLLVDSRYAWFCFFWLVKTAILALILGSTKNA